MSEPKVGFEIQGRFYPWIPLDSWKTKESRVARHVAGCTLRTLLTGGSDNTAVNMAFAAVSFWRGNPEADEDGVARFMDELTAADLKLVGFDQPELEDDARPPDETPGSEPSENGESSSESSSEKPARKTSGSRR
jgi:hypothetical protein